MYYRDGEAPLYALVQLERTAARQTFRVIHVTRRVPVNHSAHLRPTDGPFNKLRYDSETCCGVSMCQMFIGVKVKVA